MKSKRRSFTIKFHRRSLHWVSVQLHSTRAAMRGVLTKLGHKDSSDTNAACWQASRPAKDNCVAEIHLAADKMTFEEIVHECCHAAHHRAVVIGIPPDDDSFQEYVAEDTGVITDALIAMFDKEKIPVRYAIVKRRLI